MISKPVLGTIAPRLRRYSSDPRIAAPDVVIGGVGYYRVMVCDIIGVPYAECHGEHYDEQYLRSEWERV